MWSLEEDGNISFWKDLKRIVEFDCGSATFQLWQLNFLLVSKIT